MKVFNLLTACAIAAPLLFVSCSDDNVADVDVPSAADGPVTLSLGMGVVTQARQTSRALPRETGFDYENNIEDAVVYIYTQPLNAYGGEIVSRNYLNAAQLTKDDNFTSRTINPASYDAGGNQTVWSTAYSAVNRYKFEFSADLEEGTTYYMLALANVGNLSVTSLDDLRNYVYKGDICSSASYSDNCGRFAMAAIREEKFTFERSMLNSNFEYSLPDLYVQRLAARIDLIFGNRGYSKDDLANSNVDYVVLDNPGTYPFNSNQTQVYFPIYDAENGSRINGAVFALEQLAIYDAVDSSVGEYLFERNNYWGNTMIMGIEEFDTESGYATHFVHSPAFPNTVGTAESHKNYPGLFANKAGTKDNAYYGGFIGDTKRIHTLADGTEYGILGYVRENTFQAHNDNNKYTRIFFSGNSNLATGHFEGSTSGTYDDGKYVVVSGSIPVRHSTGEIDTTKPLAYGIVRNTIYRIKIRFYAKGETIFARYYYYGTQFDGKENNTDLKENEYNDIPFYNFVLEGDGTAPND